MNQFIKSQIINITTMAGAFKEACKLAAIKDDGKISPEEQKQLKRIEKATDKFIKELSAIK